MCSCSRHWHTNDLANRVLIHALNTRRRRTNDLWHGGTSATRTFVTSRRESQGLCRLPWVQPPSWAVKASMPWVKFLCLTFSPSKCRVHVPLLWSCQLGFCSTIATRWLSSLAPLPQVHMFLLHVLETLGSRQVRGPSIQNMAERGHLTRVGHMQHSRRLAKRTLDRCARVHLGTIAYNLHMAWMATLFLHTFYLHLVAFSRPFPLPCPSSWPGTASFTLLPFDATGKSLPRWRLGTCAGSR